MAKTGMAAALSVALMAAVWTVETAQSSSSCTNVLISMSPCLNYITGNSSTPSTGCCTQLASVVQSQPKCLCEVISGNAAASLGITLNRTLALELPAACKVQTPSISRCNRASSPSVSPSTTPSTPSSGTSTTPSGKSTPSGDASKGQVTKAGLALFAALFLFAGSAWDLGFAAV